MGAPAANTEFLYRDAEHHGESLEDGLAWRLWFTAQVLRDGRVGVIE